MQEKRWRLETARTVWPGREGTRGPGHPQPGLIRRGTPAGPRRRGPFPAARTAAVDLIV